MGRSILMSSKEHDRLNLLKEVKSRKLTVKDAAILANLSERQFYRIKSSYEKEGIIGIVHKSRGRHSNRGFNEETKDGVIKIYRESYRDFGPTFFSEKLEEYHQIRINHETLRRWIRSSGHVGWHRKKRPHRRRRERRSAYGEMLQFDGSHHDWFEGRGDKCCLLLGIDDANSRVHMRFSSTESVFVVLQEYVEEIGIPRSIYVDRHSVYYEREKETDFSRAMKKMSVQIIYAKSPQAKGRVERMYSTFQDRVLKEMRIAKVNNIEEANQFLEWYLPIYNKRFSKEAASSIDGHHPVQAHLDLYAVLTRREERKLSKSLDFSFEGKIYQVVNCSTPRRMMNRKATIFIAMDGQMWIECLGQRLEIKLYDEIPTAAPVMDRKQLNAWLNRKAPMTVKQRIAKRIGMPA